MHISELLEVKEMNSKQFNGLLADFIESEFNFLSEFNSFFKKLIKIIPQACLYTNYEKKINHEIPSNIVIRYKDAAKLGEKGVIVPAIIYFKNNDIYRAIVLSHKHYLEAKGLYCCITEPKAEFEEVRDEIIALPLKYDEEKLLETFKEIYNGARLLNIKKKYDHEIFNSVDEMKEIACQYSRTCFETDKEVIEGLVDKRDYINSCVARTFLLKKAIYVQYMSSKDLLLNRHENNISEQRRFAKTYASDIPFIPIGRLYHPERYEEDNN